MSNLDISFKVVKEASQNYSAVVTCQSDKGTPPVTFALYNWTELVTSITSEDRKATFKVPLILGMHMGWLQCQAKNGDQPAYSKRIPVQIGMNRSAQEHTALECGLSLLLSSTMSPTVPVSGPVIISSDYDVKENYAVIGLRFYCRAAAGSQPLYRWFLNKTLLQDRGSFYYVVNQPPEQSILLLSVGRRSTGTYCCEVQDSFDNASGVSSERLFMSKEGTSAPTDGPYAEPQVHLCHPVLLLQQ